MGRLSRGAGAVMELRQLQRRLAHLGPRLADLAEEVDRVARLLGEMAGRVAELAARGRAWRPRSPEDQAVMRAEADAGVASLKMKRRADGSVDVSVSGRRSFRLRPKLAALLAILVAPGGVAEDELMGWRTNAEVAVALGKKTGRPVSPRSLPKDVYKLREAFHDAGENWLLIQTRRDRGVRFALRAIGGDPS